MPRGDNRPVRRLIRSPIPGDGSRKRPAAVVSLSASPADGNFSISRRRLNMAMPSHGPGTGSNTECQ